MYVEPACFATRLPENNMWGDLPEALQLEVSVTSRDQARSGRIMVGRQACQRPCESLTRCAGMHLQVIHIDRVHFLSTLYRLWTRCAKWISRNGFLLKHTGGVFQNDKRKADVDCICSFLAHRIGLEYRLCATGTTKTGQLLPWLCCCIEVVYCWPGTRNWWLYARLRRGFSMPSIMPGKDKRTSRVRNVS